jgi:hypothetical protein
MNKAIEKFNKFLLTKKDCYEFIMNYEINDNRIIIRKFTGTRNFIFIKIESKYIEEDDGNNDIENVNHGIIHVHFEKEKENTLGKLVYDTLKGLKFNKYFGTYDVNLEDVELLDIEMELFPEYFKYKICSVCLEHTSTKTNCGHYLCYSCWNEILKRNEYRCPECRECIRVKNSICFYEECKCHLSD